MPIYITVPRLGWSSEEGVFAGWLKRDGEKVVAGEPLFALESDKVTMEVESLDGGILNVLQSGPESGGVVKVGQVLGYLLVNGENLDGVPASQVKQPDLPASPAVAVTPAASQLQAVGSPDKARHPASPRARAKAKVLGIDISRLHPAPGSNRVVEADVLRVARSSAGRPGESFRTANAQKRVTSRARKIIAARMEESFRTPHFYVHAEADAAFLAKLREDMVPVVEDQHRVRLTYNDFLLKAVALTLRALPLVNCYWAEGEIVARDSVDIGLAMQVEDELLVPVIRGADRSALAEIAIARRSLVEKCRRANVMPSDFEGAGATISNLGPFGVDRFQAILNPPQSVIVAVGQIAKRPFVDGDSVVARLTAPISVSVDHRVIDGVLAAKFLHGVVRLLESPTQLLL
jgi:pyruvate dehydrogenase E2 component (dihydrolipoamide acetyltransferase)